jgi:hypothetical protein
MTDPMDIDALLIGALYGELTPADEARLTAHLESHPADRSALADLTQTRATFRESRILAAQLEPPQSVSALLLQEAARRAPRAAREPSDGWFQRFMRSFLMHPAMAAATMLVLVVGVAGTLYLRRGAQFAETAAPAIAPPAPEITMPAAPPPAAQAVGGTVADDKNTSAPATMPAGGDTAAGSDGYRVRLDEPRKQDEPDKPDKEDKQGDAFAKQKAAQNDLPGPSEQAKDTASLMRHGDGKEQPPRKPEPSLAPAKPSTIVPKLAKKPSGIELRHAEPLPKDLDDDNTGRAEAALGRARGPDSGASANEHARASGAGAPAGGGATAAPGMIAAQPTTPPPTAPAPAQDPSVVARAGAFTGSKSNAPTPAAKPAPRSSLAPSQRAPVQQAEPPPPPQAVTADVAAAGRDNRRFADKVAPQADAKTDAKAEAKAEDRPADDKALLGWAQKQRDQVIAFVRSNNCRAAANTATAIYNRAPEYYAANVATDLSVKPCLAYLNIDRERAERSKAGERQERSKAASKRVDAADTPAAAPPARK